MKTSTDVWFCAYLMIQGQKIVKYEVVSRGKVKCFFELTEEQWMEYKLKFNNSDVVQYKALIEQIKDLGF